MELITKLCNRQILT